LILLRGVIAAGRARLVVAATMALDGLRIGSWSWLGG